MAHAGKWEAMNDGSSVPSSLGRTTEISDDWPIDGELTRQLF